MRPDQSFYRGNCLQISNGYGRFDQYWWTRTVSIDTANTCVDFNNVAVCEKAAGLPE